MRKRGIAFEGRRLIFAVFVLGVAAVGSGFSQTSEAKKAGKEDSPKTVKFEMDNKSWQEVFAWLAETTGKPVISVYKPTGKFTYIGPANKEYIIGEVIDILNHSLRSNKRPQPYELIQRARSFSLIPADEKIDSVLLPRVRLADLAQHGESELVILVLPLTRLDAKKMATIVNVMMWPNGEVVPLTSGGLNSLILTGRAGKLKGMCRFLMLLDKVDLFIPSTALQR
jgi:hypothetical protein